MSLLPPLLFLTSISGRMGRRMLRKGWLSTTVPLCLPRSPEVQIASSLLIETLRLPKCCIRQGFSSSGLLQCPCQPQFSKLEPMLPQQPKRSLNLMTFLHGCHPFSALLTPFTFLSGRAVQNRQQVQRRTCPKSQSQ